MIFSFINYRLIGSIIFILFCQSISGQTFTLKGKISRYDGCDVKLIYFRDGINKNQSDTAIINKGEFLFNGRITGAEYAQLFVYGRQKNNLSEYNTTVFLEPGLINIYFEGAERKKIKIIGSKTQDEYEDFKKTVSHESEMLIKLSKLYNTVDSMLKEGVITPSEAEERRKIIDSKYNPVIREKSNKEILYIKKHPTSYVSLMLLHSFVGRLSNDSIELLYSTLSEKVKGSTIDYSFLAYNARVRKAISKEYPFDLIKINESAPSFTIYKPSGNDSLLRDNFFGKVLILEFWGLYCYPCLRINPLLEQIRMRYGEEKLSIIAVNDNGANELSKITTYINRNKLSEWYHVFINKEIAESNYPGYKGNFYAYLGLGVPRTVVIDKKGKIAYKNYGYSKEEFENMVKIIERVINE